MVTRLPAFVDPIRLADKGIRLTGAIALFKMTRLAVSFRERQGAVAVDLSFATDAKGMRVVHGAAKARVKVGCQRCLEPINLVLATKFKLAFVGDTETTDLPDDYEALPTPTGPVSLIDLIEDELILAIPIAPMHPRDECDGALLPMTQPMLGAPRSPFASLARWKPGG